MYRVKQYDVGALVAFSAYEDDGSTKMPLDGVDKAIIRFQTGNNKVIEKIANIQIQDEPNPDLIKFRWEEGDLDTPGLMLLEVLIKYLNKKQFTSLGYVKIIVEKAL